jgi:rod shape-determining protein MreD
VRALRLLIGVVLALLVHLIGVRFVPALSRYLDIFLIVVTLYALEGNSLASIGVGLFVGLLQDGLGNGPIGLFGFADTAVAYLTARLAQRLVIQRASGVLLVIGFASLLQQALLVLLAFVLLPSPAVPDPLGLALQSAIKAALCGVLGMMLYGGLGQWRRGVETRRRGRMGRLRLG